MNRSARKAKGRVPLKVLPHPLREPAVRTLVRALTASDFSSYWRSRYPNRRLPRDAEGAWTEALDLVRQVVVEANAFRDARGSWEKAAREFTFSAEALQSLVGVVRLRYRGPRPGPHPKWKTPQEGWTWGLEVEPRRPWHVELARLGMLAARYLDLQIAARHEGKGLFPQIGQCDHCGQFFLRRRTDQSSCSPPCRARASEERFKEQFGLKAWQAHEAHRKKKGTTKRCPCAACRDRRIKRY